MNPVVMTIAGSDPSSGSGIQLDLKTLEAWGCYAVSALTALTVQDTRRVGRIEPTAADLVQAQIEALLADFPVAAVKTGMLTDTGVVRAVVAALRRTYLPLVVDPVLQSSSGAELLAADAQRVLLEELLPLATLVTPNAPEAARLAGCRVTDAAEATLAATRLREFGAGAVLVKGGHLDRDRGTDVLIDAAGVRTWGPDRRAFAPTRGTGCMLASSVAARLAHGTTLRGAVTDAREFVAVAARNAQTFGNGARVARPEPAWARRVARRRPLGRLHVITDSTIQTRYSHPELARLASAGGADAVQFREKRPHSTRDRIDVAREMLVVLADTPASLIVNDRADVCSAVDAHGLHVGRNDLPADLARRMLGPDRWIGGTANSADEAALVAALPIDYLGVGPVFGTRSKANPAPSLGLHELRRIVTASALPVIAIGAIDADNVGDVLATGVYGIAVLSAVVGAEDPQRATARIRRAMDACGADGCVQAASYGEPR